LRAEEAIYRRRNTVASGIAYIHHVQVHGVRDVMIALYYWQYMHNVM